MEAIEGENAIVENAITLKNVKSSLPKLVSWMGTLELTHNERLALKILRYRLEYLAEL